ncbi:MAG: helix-turn-helix domain-containing protein [Spirochaetaceae bacterium]|jgi:addiction module HigA family antidote|nr:helix-turn-helix domain-containing protein [Spirochaetaceae bacterium]
MPRGKSTVAAAGKTPAAELAKQIKKLNLSQQQVAQDVGLSVMTLKKILDNKAKVDIERALVFAKYFKTTPDFWIELQKKAGLAEAKLNAKLQKQLKELKPAKLVKSEKTAASAKTAAAKKKGAKPGPKKGAAAKTAVKRGRKPRAASSSTAGFPFN